MKERRHFFFEKKKQKTFICCPSLGTSTGRSEWPETDKSFLVLFFKKERPSFYCLALLASLSACEVGPNYHRPTAEAPAAFKEQAGWKPAQPLDAQPRGAWWAVLNDPVLDGLERHVAISNQNVRAAEAAYRAAAALTDEARAGLFPTVGVTPAVSRSKGGGGNTLFSPSARTSYSLEGTASWDPDVWGKIRRQIEAQSAAAQVSQADLANAELSAQASLATDYIALRYQDSLTALLRDTVKAYTASLRITSNQFAAGTVSRADVVIAEAQLQTAQSQLIAAGVARATMEHAIAVLAGMPPAALTVQPALLGTYVPVPPTGLPSTLLERRPDIAAAERTAAEQSANIGVAVAAYYPEISLSAAFGYAGDPLSKLFTVANQAWSLGASASETVFDAGARGAAVRAARANYDEAVATYRQTVLTAFQQVEDQLSTLRILQDQAVAADAAVESTRHAVEVTLNEYRAGTQAYTAVVTEQTALLGNQEAALAIRESRLTAAVSLITALGGGWEAHK